MRPSRPGHAGPSGRCSHRRGRRGERGASLVEYALIVALLAVPTVGSIKLMQNAAASKISATAVGISTHTIPVVTVAP
jgi:Flp pilus assembly pilin Flp